MRKFPLPIGPFFCLTYFPMKSITVKPKKRGRPATGKDPLVGFRAPPELTEAIDAYAAQEPDKPARSEAIRRIVRDWLVQRGFISS